MLAMTRSKITSLFAAAIVVALAGIAMAGFPVSQGTADARMIQAPPVLTAEDVIADLTSADGVLRLDMAEDASRFVFARDPATGGGMPVSPPPDPAFQDVFAKDTAHAEGIPMYGTSFVTQGYLYPEGTLTESNGVLADGTPEFPDKVIGQWTCRGWFIGEGMLTTTGPTVVTTQIYNLGGEYHLGGEFGVATITTEGYELADVGVMVQRAITGGTGEYAGVGGEQRQTLLGLNASEGVNLSIEIDVADQ